METQWLQSVSIQKAIEAGPSSWLKQVKQMIAKLLVIIDHMITAAAKRDQAPTVCEVLGCAPWKHCGASTAGKWQAKD